MNGVGMNLTKVVSIKVVGPHNESLHFERAESGEWFNHVKGELLNDHGMSDLVDNYASFGWHVVTEKDVAPICLSEPPPEPYDISNAHSVVIGDSIYNSVLAFERVVPSYFLRKDETTIIMSDIEVCKYLDFLVKNSDISFRTYNKHGEILHNHKGVKNQ